MRDWEMQELASLVAGMILRMRSSYGTQTVEWQRDLTRATNLAMSLSRREGADSNDPNDPRSIVVIGGINGKELMGRFEYVPSACQLALASWDGDGQVMVKSERTGVVYMMLDGYGLNYLVPSERIPPEPSEKGDE